MRRTALANSLQARLWRQAGQALSGAELRPCPPVLPTSFRAADAATATVTAAGLAPRPYPHRPD